MMFKGVSRAMLALGTMVSAVGLSTLPVTAATLGGSWSGSGYVQPDNGPRESVRCRVSFSQQTAKIFSVSATRASKGNSLRQTGEVLMVRPNRFVGDFYSRQFDVAGRIAITLSGSSQTVTFSGRGVSGRLTLSKR